MALQVEQSWARILGKWERRFYTAWAYLLVLSVVIFGLTCGVTAAGLEFGAYTDYAASYGERLRTAASYVGFWFAHLSCQDHTHQLACV